MRIGFVPATPLLIPGLSNDAPLDLVAACRAVVDGLPEPIVVVGSAPQTRWYDGEVDLAGWGVRRPPTADPLPTDLAVGASLCRGRLWGVADASAELPVATSLLVVGDGCATRATTGPGPFRAGAAAYDERIVDALGTGSPQGLLDLDAEQAQDLWVGGHTAWQVVGAALNDRSWSGEVLWTGTPFGVTYVVARWSPA